MQNLPPVLFSVGMMMATAAPITAQDITSNLIAHFPLNGTPNDMIGGLAPTVISGQPGFCADRFGNPNGAACFDGASFWSYGDVLDMDTSDFALTFWMRPDSVPMEWEVSPGLISNGTQPVCKGTTVFASPTHSGYTLQLSQPTGDNYLLDWVTGGQNDDVHIAENPITIGEWMQVVVLRCDTVISMYLDGVLAAMSITPPNRNVNTDIYFTLGALNREPSGEPVSEWFIGAVDDVRLYKGRCLSQLDIAELVDFGVGVELMTSPHTALRVYPNPATDLVLIQATAPVTSLIILDAMGRTMEFPGARFADGAPALGEFELPIAAWASGTYFVVLQGDQWQSHGRFIKD